VALPRESAPTLAAADGRSVNYPVITLQAAIGQAKRLWDSVGRNLVPLSTAGAAWGYGEKSSGLRSTVSALKQYGLLEDIGDAARRQVRLLDRALDILVEPPDSPKRSDALAAALCAPKIYQELFDRFPAGLPAQDHAIGSFLLREKAFNRKAVSGFISGLRANVHFASLNNPVAAPPSPPDSLPDAPHRLPARALPPDDRRPNSINQDVFALGAEGEVVLRWPGGISQASYDELSEWLELELRKIARINGLKRPQPKAHR
jgi:hypothetical protein